MKYFTIFLISFLGFSYCMAQDNCNCEQALKQLIQKIETEYPGFNEKTKDKLLYNNYKETLLSETRTNQDYSCIELLKKYTDFFKDGHISIAYSQQNQDSSLNSKRYDKVTINLEEFQKRIQKNTDPMEGIWKSGPYKVGIVKIKNEYQGFIIEADTNYWKKMKSNLDCSKTGKQTSTSKTTHYPKKPMN